MKTLIVNNPSRSDQAQRARIYIYTINSRYDEVGYNETPVITKCLLNPQCTVSNRFTSGYNERRINEEKLKSRALRCNESLLYLYTVNSRYIEAG